MFDFVHNNRQLVTISLGMVILGLVVGGGVAGYSAGMGESFVAKVDGKKITERDLARETGGQPIPDAMKPQVVEQLVQRQILMNEAAQRHIYTSDAQLREQIMAINDFKKDGKFDAELYKTILAAQQKSVEQFQNEMRDRRSLQLLGGPIVETGISSKLATDKLIEAMSAPREVASLVFAADQYLNKVSVSEAEIKQYYDGHHGEFNQPERVKLDYVVLSREAMAAALPVDEATLKDYFEKNKKELAQEQRHARHILISADAKASAADRAAAKQKAEKLLAELKKNPSAFAELAKANSQDPGSAAQGGDLGFFGPGQMVKPFNDAVFSLAKDQLSDVVETSYGYHIIQLLEAKTKTLDDVKPALIARIQRDKVGAAFQPALDKLSDIAYQQADSLKPAADALKLTIQTSGWLTREQAAEPLLNQAKLREAAFSADVLTKKHNTEAVEVRPGEFVVARINSHQVAALLPLAEVSPRIADKLKRERAGKLAQEEGKKALAALQKGEALSTPFQPAKQASRIDSQGLAKPALDAVFALPGNKLPAFTGVSDDTSYTVYRVAAVKPEAARAKRLEGFSTGLAQQAGNAVVDAYLAELKKQHKVELSK
ncbi:peptidylprolyl isomerase [Chitinimonas sp.]|uniref:peptidylprolyl isomerase n=1 Tax=Chitinimonas sp. TaxID=1934313 RepID=UPI0035B40F0F